MKRTVILAFAIGALLAMFMGASPAAASSGADFGSCVAHHATSEGGFSADHNPGMHQGFAGWPGCPG
jgi:hypothetical protein